MDAGRWWATPRASVDQTSIEAIIAEAAALGFLDDDLVKMRADIVGPDDQIRTEYLVWPDNMAAVGAFCRVASQWRVLARGGLSAGLITLGLDYAGVKAGLRMAHIDLDGPGFARMQWIERGAVSALNGD